MATGNHFAAACLCACVFAMIQASSAEAAAPNPVLSDPSGVHFASEQIDFLTKPHGWLRFDEVCAFGSTFAVTLDRAKRSSGRVIVRDFVGYAGGKLSRQALPSALGLDCTPYSIGFD